MEMFSPKRFARADVHLTHVDFDVTSGFPSTQSFQIPLVHAVSMDEAEDMDVTETTYEEFEAVRRLWAPLDIDLDELTNGEINVDRNSRDQRLPACSACSNHLQEGMEMIKCTVFDQRGVVMKTQSFMNPIDAQNFAISWRRHGYDVEVD